MIFLQSALAHVLPKCGALPICLLGRVWYPEGPTILFDSRPWSDVSTLRQTENTLNLRTSLHSHSRIWLSLLWFCPGRVIISNHKTHVHCVENIHFCLAEFNPVVWRWFDCPYQLVLKFNTQRGVLGRGTQVTVQSWRYKHLCELVYPLTMQW